MKSTGRESDQPFDRLIARGLARELDVSGNACPDADLLAAWFDHTLSALEGERIEAHAAGCLCCQQILAALARSEPEVIRATPLPAPSRAWHWHWRWAVPLATAVLVVVVGSHTLRAPSPVLPPAGAEPVSMLKGPAEVPPSAGLPAREGRSIPPQASPPSSQQVTDSPQLQGQMTGKPAPSRMAELAQRPADIAGDKMLKAAAPSPAVSPVAESVAVAGRASSQGFGGSPVVRQASVTTSMLSGSAVSWRFGQDGAIEKSSDRGQTWVRQSSGVATTLSDASAPSDRVCWIVGAGGVVLRTTDGVTWQRLTSPTETDLVAVHAWNDLAATVTASDRSDYETTDGGKTWKRRK